MKKERLMEIAGRLIDTLSEILNECDESLYDILTESVGMSDSELKEFGIDDEGNFIDEDEEEEEFF